MRPVRVDFDAQLLMEAQKTGIGRMAYAIIDALADEEGIDGALNLFTLRKRRGYDAQWEEIGALVRRGLRVRRCAWFHDVVYKLLWNFIPLPYRLFFGKGAEVTHFFNYYIPPGVANKRVSTVCDMVFMACPETMNAKTRWMLRLSLQKSVRRAHHIVTISAFSKREILRYLNIDDKKVSVIPLGVDVGVFRPDIPQSSVRAVVDKYGLDDDYFLYLGTLEPRKNLVRLIEAYAALCRARPDAPLLCIAGRPGWQYDEIFTAVEACGVASRVVFTGYVDQGDAPALIAGAHAFVFVSLYEGFGLPPLEAMACATPVIASDIPPMREVVGDAGLLVDPLDVGGIADAMARVMDDGALRARLSALGHQRAQTFSWDKTARALAALYARLAREG
jgi:glycosyltransferase involved in cell wall biosynthesis